MKAKLIMKSTDNSRVYKIAYRYHLDSYEGVCSYCPPNKGCNAWRKRRPYKNWKRIRKTQWKNH